MTLDNISPKYDPTLQKHTIEQELRAKTGPIERKILNCLTSPNGTFDGVLDPSELNAIFENLTYSILIEEQSALKKLVRASDIVFTVASQANIKPFEDQTTPAGKQHLVVNNTVNIVHPKNGHLRSFTVHFSFIEETEHCNLKLENDEIDIRVEGGLLEKLSSPLIAGKVRKRVLNPCQTIKDSLTHRLAESYDYSGKIKDVRLDLKRSNKLHVVIERE